MIEPGMAQQIADAPRHPRFLIPRAEDHPVEPGQHDRPGAHRARFQRHEQLAPFKPPGA
jgi:hypothetical protein